MSVGLPSSLDQLRDLWIVAIPSKGERNGMYDYAILSSADTYASASKVGATKKFWFGFDQGPDGLDIERSDPPPDGFRSIKSGALRDVFEMDTLVLVAHGSEKQVGYWPNPEDLAALMYVVWGLRIVGELKLAACLVGQGNYLRDLRDACNGVGIGVRKFIAYTKEMETARSWGGQAIETASMLDWLLGKEWYRVELPGNIKGR